MVSKIFLPLDGTCCWSASSSDSSSLSSYSFSHTGSHTCFPFLASHTLLWAFILLMVEWYFLQYGHILFCKTVTPDRSVLLREGQCSSKHEALKLSRLWRCSAWNRLPKWPVGSVLSLSGQAVMGTGEDHFWLESLEPHSMYYGAVQIWSHTFWKIFTPPLSHTFSFFVSIKKTFS